MNTYETIDVNVETGEVILLPLQRIKNYFERYGKDEKHIKYKLNERKITTIRKWRLHRQRSIDFGYEDRRREEF